MIFVWLVTTVIFFGVLVLALALAKTAAMNDTPLSEQEARDRLRPSGGVSTYVEPRP